MTDTPTPDDTDEPIARLRDYLAHTEGYEDSDLLNRISGINPASDRITRPLYRSDLRKLMEAHDDLAAEVRRLRDENDTMHEDVVRFLTHRNIVCQRAASHVIPGPDGQDDIDRRKLIADWVEEGWDEVDGWQELAAKGAKVIAERDTLRTALREALDAFDECTGDYAKELAADDLARWRAVLAGTDQPTPDPAPTDPTSSAHAPVAVPGGYACGHCEQPWPCLGVAEIASEADPASTGDQPPGSFDPPPPGSTEAEW